MESIDRKHISCSTHCCQIHGCKYGYDDCPVATGQIQGMTGTCEQCGLEASGYYGDDAIQEVEQFKKQKIASVYLAKERLDKSYQNNHPPVISCVHCGGNAHIAMVIIEDVETDRHICDLHQNDEDGYLVHDVCCVAIYFCKKCLKVTAEMNQG